MGERHNLDFESNLNFWGFLRLINTCLDLVSVS